MNDEQRIAWVRGAIKGRIALRDPEPALLMELCRKPGDHLDIGTLWGGSAILAAWAKPAASHVVTLDNMTVQAWSPGGDPFASLAQVTPEIVLRNFHACAVAVRISFVLARSFPWPLPGRRFGTALLDGDHEYPSVERDWASAVACGCDFIAVHDYGQYGEPPRPGPREFIEEQVRPGRTWREWGRAGSLIVFQKFG